MGFISKEMYVGTGVLEINWSDLPADGNLFADSYLAPQLGVAAAHFANKPAGQTLGGL